ncbi:C-X-C motif chemokine 2-like [Lampris incognitus]|uniref:C-X-C motif chemokine 2-like n=1 Tax=Lampris incognitus TaxID=2546036 RepID=UPI0024B4A6FE|nr:C-X-C motif chemokine 2-like [Lampris incognitus]
MNTAIASAVLLLCVVVCTSEGHRLPTQPRCLCVSVSKSLTRKTLSQIDTVKRYGPRPHCSQTEVIMTLKNGSQLCLDPTAKFTETVLKVVKRASTLRQPTKKQHQ